MRIFKASTYDKLFQPVHPASLGLLRIAFGVLMLWEFGSVRPYIIGILTNSKFFLTFDYFHWVKPVAPATMEIAFLVGKVAAVALLLGFMHRLSSLVVFIIWTYILLVCGGHYTNHYYLFSLVGFWMFMSDANRWASVDLWLYKAFPWTQKWILGFSPDKTTVPYWQVFVFQAQLVIVYFYGGLAKISWDWFQGYPMRIWLPMKPWLPDVMKSKWVAIAMSWGGMIFDLAIGWVMWSRYRKWGLPFLVFFHLTNDFVFRTIGGFPYFMGAATVIFFPPRWPQDWIDRLKLPELLPAKAKPTTKSKAKPATVATAAVPTPKGLPITGLRRVFLGLLIVYGAWQTLYPLRHFLYPGDPSLTGEGSRFGWRMMLTCRDYGAKFKVVVNGETFYITGDSFFYYMNFRQFTRICRMPKQFHRFAQFIKREMQQKDPQLQPEIYGFLIVQYNGRPFRHLIDTTVNLAAIDYETVGHVDWVYDEYMTEPPGQLYDDRYKLQAVGER